MLYVNTNKPHFFFRIPVVLERRRSSQGGVGGCAHPRHAPPRSAPAPDPSSLVSFLQTRLSDRSYRLAYLARLYEKGLPAVYARAEFFYETFVVVWDQVSSVWLITANVEQHFPKAPFNSSSLTTPSLTTPFKKSKFKSFIFVIYHKLFL